MNCSANCDAKRSGLHASQVFHNSADSYQSYAKSWNEAAQKTEIEWSRISGI
jgi:transposase